MLDNVVERSGSVGPRALHVFAVRLGSRTPQKWGGATAVWRHRYEVGSKLPLTQLNVDCE